MVVSYLQKQGAAAGLGRVQGLWGVSAHQTRTQGRGPSGSSAMMTSRKSVCVSGSRFFANTRWTCHTATAAACSCSSTAPSFDHSASCASETGNTEWSLEHV